MPGKQPLFSNTAQNDLQVIDFWHIPTYVPLESLIPDTIAVNGTYNCNIIMFSKSDLHKTGNSRKEM